MDSKASIHSSHSSKMEERVIQETTYYDEKKTEELYSDEKEYGSDHINEPEDSPIEEVRAVVPK